MQTLSRQYISAGGQDTENDKYFNLSGVTYSTAAHIGTLNTNYYATSYGYDSRGLRHAQLRIRIHDSHLATSGQRR